MSRSHDAVCADLTSQVKGVFAVECFLILNDDRERRPLILGDSLMSYIVFRICCKFPHAC